METFSNDMPWVIFHLMKEQFAVSTKYVREMVAMPKVVPVPQTPSHIRGIINLRGGVLPVMDLRLRLGMPSFSKETDDLVELLLTREQDHKNWINELEASVREHREFKLATDPHKCGFGKWYDNFKTDNRVLESCLKKFDLPHQTIHGVAIKVKAEVEKKDYDSAFEIINQTRENELTEMIKLFAEAVYLLKETTREIALVLKWEEITCVVSLDSVAGVDNLSMSDIEDMPEITNSMDNEFIFGIGKREKEEKLIQLIDVVKLISKEAKIVEEISKGT